MLHPRKIAALLTVLLALFSTATYAQDAGKSATLHGSWSKAQALPDGRSLLVVMTLKPDMTFAGTASLGGAVVWEYAGEWESDGATITYRYLQSSRPLPDAAKTDVDEVLSVSADSLALRSRASGQAHVFTRAR